MNMISQLCFQPFCSNFANIRCRCSLHQLFCGLHVEDHAHFPDTEIPIDKIFENRFDGFEYPENPIEVFNNNPNRTIKLILLQIYKLISALQKIRVKLLTTNKRPSYFAELLKNGLLTIEEHNEFLSQLRIGSEYSSSIEDFPLTLLETMKVCENVKMDIKFFKKLNEVLLLENEVKSHWLARITESPKRVYELKSEFIKKINDIGKWCSKHKNAEDTKFINLMNGLRLISRLVYNDFEAKHFYRVYKNRLIIYGAESWKKSKFYVIPETLWSFKSHTIELPNCKIFCLFENICGLVFDLKTMKIQKSFNILYEGNQFACIYHDNCVYFFGSVTFCSYSNFLQKYDLIKNITTDLPSPNIRASCGFSCAIFRDSILFCAKNSSGLYKFDLSINSYSDIQIYGIYSNSNKILLTWNMRVYIVDIEYSIFESEVNNEYIWNKVSKYQKYYYVEGFNVIPKNSVYFSIIEEDRSMNI